ncbi:MAG TPA: CAP domain-containing protein [Thermoanaerobaculia bacterium]|nr:CAP domain-containing protein [Thermoanaerobaculia bacterium]
MPRLRILTCAVLALPAVLAGPVPASPGLPASPTPAPGAAVAIAAAPAADPAAGAALAPHLPADPTAELLVALNAARAATGLPPLAAAPPLVKVAAQRAAGAAASGDLDGTPETVTALTQDLRHAGYRPYAWRQRLVQGPRDAAALLRQWQASDPDGYAAVVMGDFESFGAAYAADVEPPLWSLLFALPRLTWERRLAAPLDDVATIRAGVLALVNAERATQGLPPLVTDPRLEAAAQAHAEDMAAHRYFDHESPEGHSPAWRARHAEYGYRWIAENIAKGLFTPAEVVERWMLSSAHRQNILSRPPIHAGIGMARTEENGEVTALWVLDLAAPG